ncbi:MAG: FHA domain-containing protein [Myxococcota bacterium]
MSRLYEYVVRSRGLARGHFEQKYAHPFLVVRHRKDAQNSQWSFKTQTVSSGIYEASEALEQEGISVAPEVMEFEVFPVTKAPDNPWPERISIGRARNNDIVLLDNSVSKLHGHFVSAGAGSLALVDAGSRNGTKVGSERLKPSEPWVVASGDTVTFGAATLTFLSAGAMYDLIESYVTSPE